MAVLLQATLTRSRAILTLDESQSCVSLDGQPPPFSGQKFLVIHPGEFSNSDQNYLEETYGVRATLTLRAGVVPEDRIGANLLTLATTGLYALIERLRAGLHMDYTLLQIAGGTVGGSALSGGQSYSLAATVNGFHEPLMFQNCSAPEPKGPDWFWAEGQDDAITGVAVILSFGGAKRLQTIESQA